MEILDRNVEHLEKINKPLADKIKNVGKLKNSYELKENLSGEFNLIVNGKFVHSVNGVYDEAADLFRQLKEDSENTIHIVYGFGLGYMVDYYLINTKGQIIVYEPDVELLRVVLEIVDFTKQLRSPDLFIASSIEELKMAYDMFFRYKHKTDVSCLDFYKYHRAGEYNKFLSDLNKLHNIYAFNYRFYAETTYKFLCSNLTMLNKRIELPELESYKDVLKDKPAVIVSAGPSLAKNIETLKKAKNHVVIFCVGAAYKTLYENGITPDFAVLIEKFDTSVHYTFPNNKDVNMIIEPFTNYNVFKAGFKRLITSVSYETATNHWFKKIKNECIGNFEAKGTVSYQALSAAKFMGCNPLILLGQDLAYVDGKCYAQGSQYEDLECVKDETTGEYKVWPKNYEKFKNAYMASVKDKYSEEVLYEAVKKNLDKITKGLTFVDGQNGEKLPTQSGYAMFIQYFQDFALANKETNTLINSSTGGANIEGFENIPLQKAIEPYLSKKIDVEDILRNVSVKPAEISYCYNRLELEVSLLKQICPLLAEGQELVKKTNAEFMRHKKSTPTGMLALKKAIELYSKITNDHYIRNLLYRLIATQENCELRWYLKEENNLADYNVQKSTLELLKNYYFDVDKKCARVLKAIEKNLELMNESCTAKS